MDKKNQTVEAPVAEKQIAAPDPHTLNVYQKLILARKKFLDRNVKKSGKNIKLEFMYFELQDIVPTATRIFNNVGLLGIVNFTPAAEGEAPVATMQIINVDNPADSVITFAVPYREVEQIVSNAGKAVTNPLQALGSSVTYLRRYLWMLAMDIVEQDDIDPNLGQDAPTPAKTPAKAPAKPSKPATPAQRETIKVALTQADGAADSLMIDGLKAALNTLRKKDESKEEFVQEIALKTEGFTKITRAQCEELVKTVQTMIEEYK